MYAYNSFTATRDVQFTIQPMLPASSPGAIVSVFVVLHCHILCIPRMTCNVTLKIAPQGIYTFPVKVVYGVWYIYKRITYTYVHMHYVIRRVGFRFAFLKDVILHPVQALTDGKAYIVCYYMSWRCPVM